MKKALAKFANALLSKESMRSVKGGVVYCYCPDRGEWVGFPDTSGPENGNCVYRCANG